MSLFIIQGDLQNSINNLLNFCKFSDYQARMSVLKIITSILLKVAVFTLLVACLFQYSVRHPNYKEFQAQIKNLSNNNSINFSNLNNGKWKTACLFGGYTNPSYFMKKHGNIGWIDYIYQPMKAWTIIRLAQVEEHEALIAYVDDFKNVHFVHFKSGRTKTERTLEHFQKCTTHNKPTIKRLWK